MHLKLSLASVVYLRFLKTEKIKHPLIHNTGHLYFWKHSHNIKQMLTFLFAFLDNFLLFLGFWMINTLLKEKMHSNKMKKKNSFFLVDFFFLLQEYIHKSCHYNGNGNFLNIHNTHDAMGQLTCASPPVRAVMSLNRVMLPSCDVIPTIPLFLFARGVLRRTIMDSSYFFLLWKNFHKLLGEKLPSAYVLNNLLHLL